MKFILDRNPAPHPQLNTQDWLRGLIERAGFTNQASECTAFPVNNDRWEVNVVGDADVIDFVTHLLGEPLYEGSTPRCPNCGERSWAVDCDIKVRASVWVGDNVRVGDDVRVYVDRTGPADTELVQVGNIACNPCAWEPGQGRLSSDWPGASKIYDQVSALAKEAVEKDSNKATWSILRDYRDF